MVHAVPNRGLLVVEAHTAEMVAERPNAKGRIAALRIVRRIAPERRLLRLLDFLEHLEDAFRRTGEKTLVGLAEAATLEGIAAGSGSFGHRDLLVQM